LVCRLKAGAMSSLFQTPQTAWYVAAIIAGLALTAGCTRTWMLSETHLLASGSVKLVRGQLFGGGEASGCGLSGNKIPNSMTQGLRESM
jgi:hypothetical protein